MIVICCYGDLSVAMVILSGDPNTHTWVCAMLFLSTLPSLNVCWRVTGRIKGGSRCELQRLVSTFRAGRFYGFWPHFLTWKRETSTRWSLRAESIPRLKRGKIAEFKVSSFCSSCIFFKWELAVFSQKKGSIQNDREEGQGLFIMFFPDNPHLAN